VQISLEVQAALVVAAKLAATRAYARYSQFRVGAAILTNDNHIFSGCNVENASYGLTNCAERTAVFKAISEGDTSGIKAVVVYTPTKEATPPCGACRQVLNEFGPKAEVLSICDTDHCIEMPLDMLLPRAFGPRNLS
jgi:cytidine deaminase